MKFIKELVPYVVITAVVIVIRLFIVSPVQVDGLSMYPTLNDNEYLILNKFDKTYERFDVVVLMNNKTRLVKRIIGMPGDTIEYKDNVLYINGKKYDEPFQNFLTSDFKLTDVGYEKIPEGYYFVVGDNRNHSSDSRRFGPVKKSDILGTIKLSVSRFKLVK